MLYLNKGTYKFARNREFAAEMIRRKVINFEKHISMEARNGLPPLPSMNRNGYAWFEVALSYLRDAQCVTRRTKPNGLYELTHYGKWVVEQWFNIRGEL